MEKICGFYVSDVHLVTMILPFINEQLQKKVKIQTFFENDLNNIVCNILSKMIIKEKNEKDILNINWKRNIIKKYTDIEKDSKNLIKKNSKTIFLISGSKNYIEETNIILSKLLKQDNSSNMKLINCYEVSKFDENIKEILDKYEFILNTSGIHKIQEVFENYKREKAN